MITEYGPRAHVNDHEQPDPFHLEFVFEAERIADDDLEPDIKPVAVELDNLVRQIGDERHPTRSYQEAL